MTLNVDLVETAGIEPASANPLPSVLHAYPSLLRFNRWIPDGQGRPTARSVSFSDSAPNKLHRDSVRYDF